MADKLILTEVHTVLRMVDYLYSKSNILNCYNYDVIRKQKLIWYLI